jgi:hypothetical protein
MSVGMKNDNNKSEGFTSFIVHFRHYVVSSLCFPSHKQTDRARDGRDEVCEIGTDADADCGARSRIPQVSGSYLLARWITI